MDIRKKGVRTFRFISLCIVMLLVVASFPLHIHAFSENVTLHVTNILNRKMENGHVVVSEGTLTMNPNNTKTFPRAAESLVGGASVKPANGLGYKYQYLGGFILATEDSGVVLADSIEEMNTIKKISNPANGKVIVTFKDDSTQEIDSTDVYISPVYKATANWYLNYHYIDNISTGSGSWSNKDAVTEYKHTYKEPERQAHYQFLYWENEETGIQYKAGDEAVYTSAEMPAGTTKDVYVYAWWQPSTTVVYHYAANVSGKEKEAFEDIDIYAEGKDCDHQGLEFLGWYDAEGNKFEEGGYAGLPGPTKEKADREILHVYARYKVTVTPQDNDKVCGEQDPELTAEVSGLADDDSIEYSVVRETGENVGEYEIRIEDAEATSYPDGTQKYEIETETAVFTITPSPVPPTGDSGRLAGTALMTLIGFAGMIMVLFLFGRHGRREQER